MNEKEGSTINKDYQKVLNKSGCKPNKIWVDKGSESYNDQWNHDYMTMTLFKKKWKEVYSTYNKGKSVVAERFMRTLKVNVIDTSACFFEN